MWTFLLLLARELEERAIGQCPWLPIMCFRTIHELSGGSTWVCVLY